MKFDIKVLVGGGSTDGRMAAFSEKTLPGAGPPMHIHAQQVEVFHVIKGKHLFVVDGNETIAGPGECLLVPSGSAHRFQNVDEEEGMIHFELLPAGSSETFFHRLVAGDFDRERVGAFFAEYGIALVADADHAG
jgi:quercetin dioxygenase-like cupin family protein